MSEDETSVTVEMSNAKSLAAVLVVGLAIGFSSGILVSPGTGVTSPASSINNSSQVNTVSLDGVELQNEPSMGDSGASIKMIEYTDLACPFCAEWNGIDASARIPIDQRQVKQQVKNKLIDTGKVELIQKDYPAHPNSLKAHIAAGCVYEQSQDAYWKYHDSVMQQRDIWMESGNNDTQKLLEIASELDINQTRFQQCYATGDTSEIMNDARNIANSAGRIGTPTFFIGNREKGFIKISGAQPYSKFEQAYNKITS